MTAVHSPSTTNGIMPVVAPDTAAAVAEPSEKVQTSVADHNDHSSRASSHSISDDLAKDSTTAKDDELARTESNFEYPKGKQVAVIMVAILLALFLVALDRTIIATAIPKMTDEFHSIDDIGWYGSAFLLTSAAFQLMLGRVYTFYTPKYVFLIIIFIFEVGSAVCGAAPNSLAFIIGRAIAGAGAAGVMSGGMILMTSTVPLAKRPLYQGLFGAVFGVASVVGPLLGGVFTTDVSWRWCFYINLPIGAVVMVVIAFILEAQPGLRQDLTFMQKLGQLDLLGEFFLLPSIICLLLALQWGGSTYAWSDGRIIALLVLFIVLAIAFILVQIYMPETATLPASVICNRNIIAASCYTFCLASSMMLLVYYLPIWFQAIKGVTAVHSGIDTIPMILALVVGTISSGILTSKIGYYIPCVYACCIIMPIGAGMISMFDINTPSSHWIGFQVLFGFGLGVGMQQGGMTAQTVMRRQDVPTAVSVVFFFQMLGGAIFISIGENVFTNKLVTGLLGVVNGLDPQKIVATGATDLRTIVPADQLEPVLVAYNEALRQTFYAATAMAAMTILGGVCLQWKSVKGKKTTKTDDATAEKGTTPDKADEVTA